MKAAATNVDVLFQRTNVQTEVQLALIFTIVTLQENTSIYKTHQRTPWFVYKTELGFKCR